MRKERLGPDASTPCLSWVENFAKSHDEIKALKSQDLEEARATAGCKQNLDDWFQRMSAEVHPESFPPALVFNMDETMVNVNGKKLTVYVPRDTQKGLTLSQPAAALVHMSLALCISADGRKAPPLIILPLQNFPIDLHLLAEETDYVWAGQANGWMTTAIFEEWVEKVFVPHVQHVRQTKQLSPSAKALLFLDSHESRKSLKAIELLQQANVVAVTLPAHTSHIMQPLDRGVHGYLKQWLVAHKRRVYNTDLPTQRFLTLALLRDAIYHAANPTTIKEAFRQTGLCPWNFPALVSPYITDRPNWVPLDQLPRSSRQRTRIRIDSQVLTSEVVVAALKERADRKRKREEKQQAVQRKRQKRQLPSDPALIIPQEGGESDEDEHTSKEEMQPVSRST